MSRVNELRALVRAVIMCKSMTDAGLKNAYYEVADTKAIYPHIVFDIDSAIENDLNRKDYQIIIDVYDKSTSATKCEELADKVEDMFCGENMPQSKILPTFYLESRRTVMDEDKEIKHKQLRIIAQLYEA